MTRDSYKNDGPLRQPDSMKTVVAEPQVRSSPTKGILTVIHGTEIGKIVPVLSGEVVSLGRSDECTMRFDDTSLSRVHARVTYAMNTHMIGDAGSTNGTFVNDERIAGATRLKDGDRILLGTSTILRFSLVTEEEEAALQRVYDATVVDGLTGIANRKHLEQRLEAEFSYAVRHGMDLSLIVVDLDHFKAVNDTYGHLAGDEVLKQTVQVLKESLRREDFLGRYGGEEFVVVARGTDAPHAVALAERLRTAVARTPIVFENHSIVVTMSAGVASLADCGPIKDRSSLFSAADERLYLAKQAGRNRVMGQTVP